MHVHSRGGQRRWLGFEQLETRTLLSVTANGDYDGSRFVDGADYLAWQRDDGSTQGLAAWQSNYGSEVAALRMMEELDRGVVATRTSSSAAFVSWRLLGLDPAGIEFNVYRSQNGGASWTLLNAGSLGGGTNFTDSGVNLSVATTYRVNPVIGGVEQAADGQWTLPANAEIAPLFRIPLQGPHDRRVHSIWPGDADGDGQYELFGSLAGTTAGQTQKLVAYKLDGTFLWEVDFGPNSIDPSNIYPSASAIIAGQWDGVTVYDIDSDGQAEVIVKSSNGVTFGNGTTLNHGDNVTQFISILDGMTGAEEARAELPNPWKSDNNYALGTLFGIGYPDGERPSLMIHAKNRTGGSGTPFNTINSAWNYRDGVLTNLWSIQWNGTDPDAPEASHQMRLVDVDGDGKDELVPGIHAIDEDGSLLYDLHDGGYVHGDRFHVSDLDPNRPGLEFYGIQQNNPSGVVEFMLDAATGETLWTNNIGAVVDAARGIAADIDPRYPGFEVWSFYGMRTATGVKIADEPNRPWPNLQIWWDGDLLGEVMDREIIDKWNFTSQTTSRLLTAYNYGANTTSATRETPAFYGDILGDWREEIVFESGDHSELIVFTTPHVTSTRLYTLAHNPAYRNQMTVKGYVQQNLPDYYLGNGMSAPPTPQIRYTALQAPTPNTTYQAEYAVLTNVSVDSNHAGHNGAGFVNFPTTGGSVEWLNVAGGAGGTATLQFRYALGAASSRTGRLAVNGVSQAITFQPTGAWNAWAVISINVPLNSGVPNRVTLESTGEDLANIDQLEVSFASGEALSNVAALDAAIVELNEDVLAPFLA